ncbi:MAG: transposase [bacterium]|nr:transposase [bacterium]
MSPRTARIDLPDQFYHITNRGERKEKIFLRDIDYMVFYRYLVELWSELDFDLNAYVLMPNHFHLLIYRRNSSLGEILHRLETRYAEYFNKEYNLVGHVYQERYHSFIIANQNYLKNVVYYIHRNPIDGYIVEKEENYNYSSASIYHGLKKDPTVKVINLFSGKDGIKKYIKGLYEMENFQFPLFRDAIGEKQDYLVIEKRKNRIEKFNRERRNAGKNKREILELCKYDSLKKSFKTNKLSDEQKRIILNLYKKGLNKAEISRILNCSASTVTRYLKRCGK